MSYLSCKRVELRDFYDQTLGSYKKRLCLKSLVDELDVLACLLRRYGTGFRPRLFATWAGQCYSDNQ